MQFLDHSPPLSPTPDQQRDALRKGLGRAMLWASSGWLDEGMLLAACLQDQRFDTQIEACRGHWLWGLIRAAGAAHRFRVPILHALYDLPDDGVAGQLCELAFHYAESGDETFRARLYEVVGRKPIADCPWLGEEEVVRLDGEKGFLFAARLRGGQLVGREWDWDDDALVKDAEERLGEGRLAELLAGTTDEAVRRFRDGWVRQKMAEDQAAIESPHLERARSVAADLERVQSVSADELIASAGSGHLALVHFLRWGRHADEANLDRVFRHLLFTEESPALAGLIAVFMHRGYPRFDSKLIEFCHHGDPVVRFRAFRALEGLSHPAVREFAISEIEKATGHRPAVGLLVGNYRRGDEDRILESVELPELDDERHELLMDTIRVLEANPEADCSRLGIVAYASNPCQICRGDAVRLLHRRGAAPGWLTEECRYDAEDDCREFAGADASRKPSHDE